MTPLILGVDSGLDGAFVWMRGGVVLHHVLTRTIVTSGRLEMGSLEIEHVAASRGFSGFAPRIAYLEEPFNAAISGGASTSGYTDQCKRWGRLQGWLESWGYEVKGVQAKTWQREVLDLARFEVRTEKACAPRLAEGWTFKATVISGAPAWSLRHGGDVSIYNRREGQKRADAIAALLVTRADCAVSTKSALSHDTKAASIAWATEHYPEVNLVLPRCRVAHDGLADAICIASWAGAQKEKTP